MVKKSCGLNKKRQTILNAGSNVVNVLMIVSWYSPHNVEKMSAGIFHYEQAIALKKYCDTAIYYPYDKDLDVDFLSCEENGMKTYRARLTKKNKIKKITQYISDFKRIRQEFKPDIIHAHVAGEAGVVAIILGKLYSIPIVITEHCPIELYGLERKKTRLKVGLVYHNSKRNVCVSRDFMERINKIYPKENFEVIYNGIINPSKIKLDEGNYRLINKENCCIVASFYSEKIKGYQYLLPAIRLLKKRGYEVALHIVGGGIYMDKYKKMAMDMDLKDNCIFYGNCERQKVYSIIKQMDFSISASIFECSGVSVQEAMLLGKPLVVTKSGGADSLVNEETAIVVERESVEALANGIEKMLSQKSLYKPAKIRQYALENFEIDEVSKRYMNLYKEVLEEK